MNDTGQRTRRRKKSEKMRCPKCVTGILEVAQTISGPREVARRRKCAACGEAYTTSEKLVGVSPDDRALHLAVSALKSVANVIENCGIRLITTSSNSDWRG